MKGREGAIMIVVLFTFGIISGAFGKDDSIRKKAKHYYLEAAIKDAEGQEDQAYELYKKAYETDPEYIDAANAYGSTRFFLTTDTLSTRAERLKSMELARRLIDRYPADQFAVVMYGYMAQVTDTLEEAIRVYEDFSRINPGNIPVIIHKAEAYGALGQADSAVAAIKHYERIQGTSFESTLQKVKYHLMENDTAAIIQEMTDLVASNPKNIDYILCKGRVFEILDMPDSAMYYIKLAQQIDPNDGKVKNELAQCYAQQGDSIEYDRLTYEALLSEDLEMEVKVNILREYLQRIFSDKSDTKRSDKLFQTLEEQYPHEPEILELGAQYAAAKEDFPKAIEQIKYALDLDAQNMDYINMLLTYLLLDNNPEEAMAVYEQGLKDEIKMYPSSGMLYATAANTLKQYDKALALYDKQLKDIVPDLSITDSLTDLSKLRNLDYNLLFLVSNYYEMAGDIWFEKGELNETFRSYENAISIFPDNALALNNYAYFIVEKGGAASGTEEFEKAKKMSRRALELTQQYPVSTYLDTYAWILFKEGAYKEAEDYQRQALEIFERDKETPNVDYYSHYGDILFMNGKPDEALVQWKKALELEPDNKLLQKKVKHKTFFYD